MIRLLARHYLYWVREAGLIRGSLWFPLDVACLWAMGGCLGGTLRVTLERYQ